jgi:hypothetical protein
MSAGRWPNSWKAGHLERAGLYALVHNNLFLDNVSDGGAAHLVGVDDDFRNNILAGGEGPNGGADFGEGSPGATVVEFNASWRVPPPTFGGEPVIGAGNLETDCELRDAAARDYGLASGSPCIDAGDPADAFADPDGSRADIGPFGGPGGEWTPLAETVEP